MIGKVVVDGGAAAEELFHAVGSTFGDGFGGGADLAKTADDLGAVFELCADQATDALARALFEMGADDGGVGKGCAGGGNDALGDRPLDVAGDDFDL